MALLLFFFFQAEDGIRDLIVTGVQTCALPISLGAPRYRRERLAGCVRVEDGAEGTHRFRRARDGAPGPAARRSLSPARCPPFGSWPIATSISRPCWTRSPRHRVASRVTTPR